MNNLKTLLQQLKSDKIKERQDGISLLRTVFANAKAVQNLDEKGDGRAWLVIFQALFTCVLTEKSSLTTKKSSSKNASSSAALKRLGDAAAAVRWLTERAVQRLNRKVVKPLLAHLMQTMVYQGELLMPVALDYVKAIRCVVGFTPHLEHMDEDTWVRIVEMGWNVVLGDPVRRALEVDDEAESAAMDEEADDDDMFVDDPKDDEEGGKSSSSPQSLKRRRAPSATPRPTPSGSKGHTQSRVAPPPSLEQIEFNTLLTTLLRFQSAPLLSPNSPHLAASLLRRQRRFIIQYPTDTSMHHDYVLGLSATLSHLSLNKKQDVIAFARGSWDGLVGLWGTKNKRMKEALVCVLRILFPFYTVAEIDPTSAPNFSCSDGLGRLWHLLHGEAESRWGVDGLALDSLRLELASDDNQDAGVPSSAFVKNVLRAGWHFDEGQALTWAILELHADCTYKLFELSESTHSTPAGSTKGEGKRVRLESPITSLLQSIQAHSPSNARAFHMQSLLFLIDQHWLDLHNELQSDVMSTLAQFTQFDDGVIQSWTFICLTAIAFADGSSSGPRDTATWDPIWTLVIRCANNRLVCRAACHAAHTLLSLSTFRSSAVSQTDSRRLLTSQRVLHEIETLAQDIDVKGPPFPYDSVCAFLAACLRVASQDVRLFRMQLEDKVVAWLMGCWSGGAARVTGIMDRSRMPLYTSRDVLVLLESICTFSKKSDFVCRTPLPDCIITETMSEEQDTQLIRDFLLRARLPRYWHPSDKQGVLALDPPSDGDAQTGTANRDLVSPRGRERKVSAYLQKCVEGLLPDWESVFESNGLPSAEQARRSLDMAVIALSFESLLVLNGIVATRSAVQSSSKLLATIVLLVADSRWTTDEKLFILLGLEPLISDGSSKRDDELWEALVPPDAGTGIKRKVLKTLGLATRSDQSHKQKLRLIFQKLVWQNADAQDAITSVTKSLKDVLSRQFSGNDVSEAPMDVDDRDGFAPIRTTQVIAALADTSHQTSGMLGERRIASICVNFLAVVPVLQSSSGAPTRDKELTELVLNCPDDKFLLLSPAFFGNIRRKYINIGHVVLDNFLGNFEFMLQQYQYSRSENLQYLVTEFLDSTLDQWSVEPVAGSDVGGKVRLLCRWLGNTLQGNKIRSWRTRDVVCRFLTRYIVSDPAQIIWSTPLPDDEDEVDGDALPASMLPRLGADQDIRIRFRAATANARLFEVAKRCPRDPGELYANIKRWLTTDIDDYERMVTRMLALGNVMVVSSAIRRAPYFHLLEVVFYGPHFVHHIEAVLKGVSERMGLSSFSNLFQSYASQIAFSIRQADKDILAMPPHLLGYKGRRECAKATFRAFTPTNILGGGSSSQAIAHGRRLFRSHCKTIEIAAVDGVRECFGDIVGYQIVFWSDNLITSPGGELDDLKRLIKARTDEGECLDHHLQSNVDGIIASIIRTLGDQDFTSTGSIVQALHKKFGVSAPTISAFHNLTRYRRLDDVELHKPNLPAYSTLTILNAFDWLTKLAPNVNLASASYHVMHQLFADVHNTPLVNEQIRLLNGISLWVAIHEADFKELNLLHTLIHGCSSILSQSDLARAAQSMLDWAFDHYRKLAQKDPRLSDILIRICCSANDYSQDPTFSDMGNDLLQWADDQALQCCKIQSLRSQVRRALPAWPHQISPELSRVNEEIAIESLSAVLGEARASQNRFRLVRRFRDFAAAEMLDRNQFAGADFWRLKECIPSPENLQAEDVDAFANLLVLNKGQINSFGVEHLHSQSLRGRHRGDGKGSSRGKDKWSPQRAIVQSLLNMLDSSSLDQVYGAYNTLRYSMSLPQSDFLESGSWTQESRIQLGFMQDYPRTPRERPTRSLAELATAEFDPQSINFATWISHLSILLSDILAPTDKFYAQIHPILESDTHFAEQILPVLVHTLLQAEKSGLISKDASFRTCLSDYFMTVLRTNVSNISYLRCIVDVVLHLRYFSPSGEGCLAHDNWLDMDFYILSRSAVACGAYTTAVLFLELASDYAKSAPEDVAVDQILYEIYNHIDEPDGFYGIKSTDPHQFLIKRFHHENQWERAFRFHGAGLEANKSNLANNDGLLRSFHAFGFDHLAIDAMHNSGSYANSSHMSYKLGWRTEMWDLPDQQADGQAGVSLYHALRAIHRERDPHTVDAVVRSALNSEMSRLRTLGSENLAEIREVTQNLMCLNQITQWRGTDIQSSLDLKQPDIIRWADFNLGMDFDFPDLENIMATRISLIRSVSQREQREQIGTLKTPFARSLIEAEKTCLIRLAEAARAADQIQIALNSTIRAQALEDVSTFEVSQEFASVLWLQNEQKLAVQYLQGLVKEGSVEGSRKASLLARLGTWASEACLEKPTDISIRYFEPATTIANTITSAVDTTSTTDVAKIYHKYALFAEQQYLAIIRSPDTIRWRIYVDRKTEEIKKRKDQLSGMSQTSRDFNQFKFDQLKGAKDKAEQLLANDKLILQQNSVACDSFLRQAIEMYSRCLEISDDFDDDGAIRLCSLWFANFPDQSLQANVRSAINRVPSRKFVFLAHQLTARLSTSPGQTIQSQQNLQSLILRMCQEHPFHSLYQVYALRSERLSQDASGHSRRQSARREQPSSQEERAAAADKIFKRVHAVQEHEKRVRAVELVCDASLEWAKHPIKDDKHFKGSSSGPFSIPDALLIRKVQHLSAPVVTSNTPLDPTLRYDNCALIEKFESSFQTAGGNNLPKITSCYGSDGKRYKQLFKGEGHDDLRQDAVMEQVFELVNIVLKRDRETRKRILSVRGYKVVPLSSQAGVLEFVGSTTPMRNWLLSAHERYRPQDRKGRAIAEALKKVPKSSGRQAHLLEVFTDAIRNFQPVMRHFFTEKHKTPINWFAMRLRYSRSVATTSIVGHMLGLGDRHISNILLDNATGEVVHIDLGIAFEQGKLLPVPERVPFRMTRDMVDGMGTSGTQGVFQRCAEETLRVLRNRSDVIMTVLEVFKHDPLYSWTASELKVQKAQGDTVSTVAPTDTSRGFTTGIGIDMSSGTADEAADRALSSVARKLDKALSVEYTVNELIAEATDLTNLATIFPGWSPHY